MPARPLTDSDCYAQFKNLAPALMKRFYDRLFDDLLVGFFFMGRDKQELITKQLAFTESLLGGPTPYQGQSLKDSHLPLNIFEGQFHRRHQVLKEVLAESDLAETIKNAWLEHDMALKSHILAVDECR